MSASKKRRALCVASASIQPPDLSDSQDDVAVQFAQLDLHADASIVARGSVNGNSSRRRRIGRHESDDEDDDDDDTIAGNDSDKNNTAEDSNHDDDEDERRQDNSAHDVDVRELGLCFENISLDNSSASTNQRRTFMPYIA
jgi:hypothetical protein